MIKHLTYQEIDKNKWDECIKTSFNGNVYAYTWYLDIVCEHWEALVENDYERVFPLTSGKKFGINYLFQPFFTQQLGVFSKNILTKGIVDDFISAIPEKYKFVEILLNSFNKADEKKLKLTPQINHELDLITSYKIITHNYSKNTKRNLKKAEKAGLTIVKNIKPDEIISLFRKNRGKTLKTLKDKNYKILSRLIYAGIYRGIVQIYGAYTQNNQLCSGVVFVEGNKKAVLLFSGSSPEARENGAMTFIIDAFIKDNSGKHLTLDFDGSNDANLSRFYKSFGSKKTLYPKLEINNLTGFSRNVFQFYKKLKG